MKYTFIDCKKYFGAGTNLKTSISDRLCPYIFRREMEKARPMREEMDGQVVYFQPKSAL